MAELAEKKKLLQDRRAWLIWVVIVPTWIIAITAIFGAARLYWNIPNTEELKDILSTAITENTEQITTLIIVYSENPMKARNDTFNKAFNKAEEKGYVIKTTKGYVIPDKWKDNNALLTDIEQKRITEMVSLNKDRHINDVLALTLGTLVKEKELSRDIKTADYHIVHLSPFEKIGIIGAGIYSQPLFQQKH